MARARPNTEQAWNKRPVGAPVHDLLLSFGGALMLREGNFHRKNIARQRIYRGIELSGYRTAIDTLERSGRGIARLNALKAICDTLTSRLMKDRPMPSIIVDDAEWELKKRAKKFREFIVGQMMETEFDGLSGRALHDGVRLGSGFTRIDDDGDHIIAERIMINDLLFDRRESKYGKPRKAICVQRVARDVLAELFPRHKDAIGRAPASAKRPGDDDDDSDGPRGHDLDDYVDTWEAWNLPSSMESTDGRHVLCVEGATLVSESWLEPRFPWSMYRFSDPDSGLYGDGMVDALAMLQHRVNMIVRDIQLNLSATGRGFFMVQEQNDIPVEMLTSMQPFKLKYKGNTPPQWLAPTPFNQAQIGALDQFIGYMYSISGVSQANAESRSALGAGASGVALDTQYDIDSDRFRMPQANYARYRLDAAQCYIDAAARVARRRSEEAGRKRSWVATSWKNRDAITQLEFSDVELKHGTYRLRIEPVGFLPDTRAGKLSVVDQLSKAGVIPKWLVPTLFDEPDLQQANAMQLAPFHNAMRKMDLLADETLPMPVPEAYNDLELELKIVVAYYNRVQAENAPDEVQDRYRQYADLVADAIQQKNAANAPPPVDPSQLPPGLPGQPTDALPPVLPGGLPPGAQLPPAPSLPS